MKHTNSALWTHEDVEVMRFLIKHGKYQKLKRGQQSMIDTDHSDSLRFSWNINSARAKVADRINTWVEHISPNNVRAVY